MRDLGFFSRNSARLSRDRIYRTRGDSLPAFSARAASSIRPVRRRARGPRNACGRYERGHPIRDRDIAGAADHPRWPRSTAYRLAASRSFPDERDLQVRRTIFFLVEAAPVDVASAPEQHVAVQIDQVVFHEILYLKRRVR